MRKLSTREKSVLEALDAEIEELETKLQKVQPLMDELNRLRKARAVMLDERSTTGGVKTGALTMETVIAFLRENGSSTTSEIAAHAGVTVGNVRAHLNRYRDERYRQNGNGEWSLIGTESEDDDEDDMDEEA